MSQVAKGIYLSNITLLFPLRNEKHNNDNYVWHEEILLNIKRIKDINKKIEPVFKHKSPLIGRTFISNN
jgi:hypothetical protein